MKIINKINALADVQSQNIGDGTSIWQFTVILPGAVIGENCNICANVFIENDVVIGNNVTIKNGVQIWDGISIGDGVFIGPNATFTNDLFPRSKKYPDKFLETRIESGASIGANATILPGITVGANAMVGAGAVVTRSVPAHAIVLGNPARIAGYTHTNQEMSSQLTPSHLEQDFPSSHDSTVKGVQVHKLPLISDMRGSLTVGEFEKQVPFLPKRYFMVFNVPSKETRGEHAHRECEQFLICARGSCSVLADDGVNRTEILLNTPELGVYLPPMTWGVQYKYSSDAVLLVFASHHYSASDYIRNYSEFLAELN